MKKSKSKGKEGRENAKKNGEEHTVSFQKEILDMRIIYQGLRLILESTTNDNPRFIKIRAKVMKE